MLSIKKSSVALLTLLVVTSTQSQSNQSESKKKKNPEQMIDTPFIDLDTAFIRVKTIPLNELTEVDSDYVHTDKADESVKPHTRRMNKSQTSVVKTDDDLIPNKNGGNKKPSNLAVTGRYTSPTYSTRAPGSVTEAGSTNRSLPYTSFSQTSKLPKSLSIIVSTRFTARETVGGAMAKILDLIGYSLISKGMSTDPESTEILYQLLPKIHLNMDNISVIDALTTIAGPSYTVVFDHRIRRTTLDVSPQRRILNRAQRLNARVQ